MCVRIIYMGEETGHEISGNRLSSFIKEFRTRHYKEASIPRVDIMGSVQIEEDLKVNLITPEEKAIYQAGFNILQRMTKNAEVADKNTLFSPGITSLIIGTQPFLSVGVKDVQLLFRCAEKSGINIENELTFFNWGYELKIAQALNWRAAELVLRQNQAELHLNLPTDPMTKSEVVRTVLSLLRGGDNLEVDTITRGLLSGYPYQDCKEYYQRSEAKMFPFVPKAELIKDPKNFFANPDSRQLVDVGRPNLLISIKDYHPDDRGRETKDSIGVYEGYGLRSGAQTG